ncbi:MAG: serine/threonine protein kinase, partial [Cystobacterineae bacterium]|nr:serine/threonine protein kinase [Cystobacterineae bacterium]
MTVKFGNYRLIRKIATGGMAEVWLAEQEGIEGFSRKVVVKRILPHLAQAPTFVLMFLNEARVASQLSHHNIVQIHDLGERGGEYFLAMEYIHGRDLGRVMQRSAEQERWVSCAVALRMVADACAGLYYAHTREDAQGRPLGLIHRDISAQNILVSFNGSVKLVDFGIAKAVNQSTGTQVGTVKGKFAYMSPEQAMGAPLDARSDIFSLGLVLYELLTAVRPFKRDNDFATWKAATQGEIRRPSEVANVSPYLDALVMRALEKKAGNRYPDASEFQMAIEEYLVENGLLVTSLHVADELTELFPEWQEEKAQLGAHIFPGQVSEGEAEELTPVGDEGIEGGGGGGFGGWL